MYFLDFEFMGLPYLVGFAALAFWRRGKLLALTMIAAAVFTAIQVRGLSSGDGPGLIGGTVILLFLAIGMVSGSIASAIAIAGSQLRLKVLRSYFILPVVAVLGFGTPFLWEALQKRAYEARNAPPASDCLSGLHRVKLGSIEFDLPISPVLVVRQAGDRGKGFVLGYFQSARDFCDQTANNVMELDSLYIDLDGYPDRRPAQIDSGFCSVEHPNYPWASMACHPISSADLPDKPTHVTARTRSTEYDVIGRSRADMLRNPMTTLADGTKQYGGSTSFYLQRPDGYFASCTRPGTPSQQYISCSVYKEIEDGLLLNYTFRTTAAVTLNNADVVERNASAILNSLKSNSEK